ncbi:MAG: DUF2589 domain-containing protein [Acetatifactor sp.]
MDVQSLIETIGTSVSEAQQGIEQHSIKRFLDYFQRPDAAMAVSDQEASEPQGLAPITEKMVLPCSDNIGRSAPVEVPLVALAHHRQVHLDKVTVRVKTRLSSDGNGSVMADINAPVLRAANALEDSEGVSGDDVGEIEMVFHVTDSAEGLSRVVQNISKTI